MVKAFYYLAESSFTDDLYQLESVWNVIILLDSIIAFLIVKAIIY